MPNFEFKEYSKEEQSILEIELRQKAEVLYNDYGPEGADFLITVLKQMIVEDLSLAMLY